MLRRKTTITTLLFLALSLSLLWGFRQNQQTTDQLYESSTDNSTAVILRKLSINSLIQDLNDFETFIHRNFLSKSDGKEIDNKYLANNIEKLSNFNKTFNKEYDNYIYQLNQLNLNSASINILNNQMAQTLDTIQNSLIKLKSLDIGNKQEKQKQFNTLLDNYSILRDDLVAVNEDIKARVTNHSALLSRSPSQLKDSVIIAIVIVLVILLAQLYLFLFIARTNSEIIRKFRITSCNNILTQNKSDVDNQNSSPLSNQDSNNLFLLSGIPKMSNEMIEEYQTLVKEQGNFFKKVKEIQEYQDTRFNKFIEIIEEIKHLLSYIEEVSSSIQNLNNYTEEISKNYLEFQSLKSELKAFINSEFQSFKLNLKEEFLSQLHQDLSQNKFSSIHYSSNDKEQARLSLRDSGRHNDEKYDNSRDRDRDRDRTERDSLRDEIQRLKDEKEAQIQRLKDEQEAQIQRLEDEQKNKVKRLNDDIKYWKDLSDTRNKYPTTPPLPPAKEQYQATPSLPREIDDLIRNYNIKPELIWKQANKVAEVSEPGDYYSQRRRNNTQPIILLSDNESEYWIASLSVNTVLRFLLLPKSNTMSKAQYLTTCGSYSLFECSKYAENITNKFVLKKPATVIPKDSSNKEWQLTERGEIVFVEGLS